MNFTIAQNESIKYRQPYKLFETWRNSLAILLKMYYNKNVSALQKQRRILE